MRSGGSGGLNLVVKAETRLDYLTYRDQSDPFRINTDTCYLQLNQEYV
jgi:hypothetical protein